jgi:hypothetical protein
VYRPNQNKFSAFVNEIVSVRTGSVIVKDILGMFISIKTPLVEKNYFSPHAPLNPPPSKKSTTQ